MKLNAKLNMLTSRLVTESEINVGILETVGEGHVSVV